jgi:SPX domain protein involved in polyphosphate accumulation
MVQFGKHLKSITEANPKFASYYLDYKSLKNALKVICDASAQDCDGNPGDSSMLRENEDTELADAEECFVLALEGEFAKIESFFRRILAEKLSEFRALCRRAGGMCSVSVSVS